MRKLEKSKNNKIEEQSESEEREYETLCKRVERSRIEEMKDGIDRELIGSLIYRQMLKDYGLKQKRNKEKPMSVRSALYIIVSLVSVSYILYQLFQPDISKLGRGESEPPTEGAGPDVPTSKGMLTGGESKSDIAFEDGSKFEHEKYFGKKGFMVEVVSRMTRMIYMLRNRSEEELGKVMESTQKNFLLHGPPGTGKTLFMKKLVYNVDLNLKLLRLREELGDEEFDKLSFSEKTRRVKDVRSLARIAFVRPSLLNSKYVGETEKNISHLFESANSDESYWASIIFIDEVDVFFSKRTEKSQDYALKSQTEFLNMIGGACDRLKSPVFLFGATNRYKVLDDAFKRRFSEKYRLDLPRDNERKEILERYLCDCSKEIVDRYDELVDLTKGTSQAQIADVVKKMSFDYDGKMEQFTWEELERKFREADPEKEGVEASSVVPSKKIKEFYFLDPKPRKRVRPPTA